MTRPRGALPSPRDRAFAVESHVAGAVPASFGTVPPKLSVWGNDRYGDCVSAEEAAAKAMYSVQTGHAETFIPDDVLIRWASVHGFLNGAVITDVMDVMLTEGITSAGTTHKDGPYKSVDWTNDAVLSSAIYSGPVKIGVAANQLEDAAGQGNGWFAFGFSRDRAIDHCVNLCGFGSAADLARLLGVLVPRSIDPAARCYLLFTWGTIGVIDRASLIAICGEAWLRTPTTPGLAPAPVPAPTPDPLPPIVPPLPEPLPPVVPPLPTPPQPPVPEPTPTPAPAPPPVPATQGSWDVTTRDVHLPEGWHATRGVVPQVIIRPTRRIVELPKGWTAHR